jgi:hypothetical protein
MNKKTFLKLKTGDRVICNYGSGATVIETGIKDTFAREMVRLKVDIKKWSCPFFFRSELKCMENLKS